MKEEGELYIDYLLSSFSYTTATGLSQALGGQVSHDKITRFLSSEEMESKEFWKLIKAVVRQYERDDGMLIFDDIVAEKPYTEENELMCWHYDHNKNRSVKGINSLNCVYYADGVKLPLGFDLVKKPILFSDLKSKKQKRRAEVTKNELLRARLRVCQANQIKYRYVLADSWYSSKENMSFIRQDLKKHFVMALKSNRRVALSEREKKQGRFTRIDKLEWTEGKPKQGWIKGLDFPVLFHRQVFTNKDGSTGILYLACSDLSCQTPQIETLYQKRWKVEVFHKTLKSHVALTKSPTKSVRTQSNHIFMSFYAAFQLECLSLKLKLNHFALRARLYLNALQHALQELLSLKSA